MNVEVKTPLTYNDALDLAMKAAPAADVHTLTRIVKALMAVDQASRDQAKEPLVSAIAALGLRADEEGDPVAKNMAAEAIDVARGR